MDDYIDEVIIRRDKKIKDGREIFVFMDHIFDLSLMNYDETALAALLERVIDAVQDVKNRRLLEDFIIALENNLRRWKEEKFLPKFYKMLGDGWSKDYELKKDFSRQNVDAGELAFFVRAAFWRIKFKRYSWDVDLARKDLECAAKIFGSAQAQSYLDRGTGEFGEELVKFKDADVECLANDVFAQVRVKIKNETASAYKKALNFIVKLLQAGFPASYAVKLSSKAQKTYLPIKGLAQTQTHRFFAAALAHDASWAHAPSPPSSAPSLAGHAPSPPSSAPCSIARRAVPLCLPRREDSGGQAEVMGGHDDVELVQFEPAASDRAV